MTPPALAGYRFGCACLLGGCLGVLYGFLRPLRPKRTTLADGLFVIGAIYAWLYLGFGVCRGDLRLGYNMGLLGGAVLWELTLGRLLRPVFRGFWRVTAGVFRWLTLPVRKIFQKFRQNIKFLFASLKKWGTIKWNNGRQMRHRSGGPYGTDEKSPVKIQAGISKELGTDEDRGVGGCRVVYGSTADAPRSD